MRFASHRRFVPLLAAALSFFAARVHTAHADTVDDIRWSAGYTLVALDPGADLARATRFIQDHGGTIALQLPPDALTGWIAPQLDAALVGHAGIQHIYRAGAAAPAELDSRADLRRVWRFFERASRGELELGADERAPVASKTVRAASGDLVVGRDFEAGPGVLMPDAIERPPVSELDVLANLQQHGLDPRKMAPGAAIAANSETMTGTISVALFFVESDGTGIDANVYDWTSDDEQAAYTDALAALSWWSAQASKHSDCWCVFRLEPHFATQDPRCGQWRECVRRPSSDFAAAVADVMDHFGYTNGDAFARVTAFNTMLRTENKTDWSYSAFVAANPTGPTSMSDGYAAWAYLGGPYAVLCQHSFAWSFKQVFAHESAHAFRACDEYSVAGYGGCASCAACTDTGYPNGNCEVCNPNPATCMMRTNSFALCPYTIGQLGWNASPCLARALPAPRLDAVTPLATGPGADMDVTLQGDFFTNGAGADFGAGVHVVSTTWVSTTSMRAHVRVDLEGAIGSHDVLVTGTDGQTDVLAAGFRVDPTPRHYVAATGAGVFPYDRPDRAAPTLAAALSVASLGDTILVAGGTYAPIAIHKTLTVIGGWDSGFTSRAVSFYPTIVQGVAAAPAVQVDGASTTALLDGLVIRGGAGTPITTADLGTFIAGGGVLCFDGAPTFRGCTIESNAAGTMAAGGGGGGVFCWRGHPVFDHCIIRHNWAARGAGVFLLDADAQLLDSTIDDNDAGGSGVGAGVSILRGSLTMRGGRVTGNHGASDGGAMHAQDGTSLHLSGITFDSNTASRDGAGLWAQNTPVTGDALRWTRNDAAGAGGAVRVTGGSLALESTLIARNHAANGAGGIHATAVAGDLSNLTVADNHGVAGAGIYWIGTGASLRCRASILSGNDTGGLVYAGDTPAVLDWNLAWQNTAFAWVGATPGSHDLAAADPRFTNPAALDYQLTLGSPALDGADPDAARNDPDGSRNDAGAHGGPRADPPATARVAGLVARDFGSHIWVQWNPSREHDIGSYVLYRGSLAELDAKTALALGTLPASRTSFDDPSPAAGASYAVVAVDLESHASSTVRVTPSSQPTDAGLEIATFALHSIAPNPANPGTWVDFELPPGADAQIAIFTVRGDIVRTLSTHVRTAGRQRLYWDGRDDAGKSVASGVYWVALVSEKDRRSRRFVVVR